jgi:L-asparaginase
MGGTLSMAPDPKKGGALSPVNGAISSYMKEMKELLEPNMPEVHLHEYTPLMDSSDMGPQEWAMLAADIRDNYVFFDGFVILMGTDTMAYAASAIFWLTTVKFIVYW